MANAQIDNEPPCHALLYFSGERLDPDAVLPLVAMPPARVRKKGQEMVRSVAGSAPVLAKRGYCSFSTGLVTSSDINDHVAILLSAIEPNAVQLKKVVDAEDLEWGIVCFFTNQRDKNSWVLNDGNQNRAAALGIHIANETISKNLHILDNAS